MEEKGKDGSKSSKQRHTKPGKNAAYIRHKRPAKRVSSRPNDVYVNKTAQFGQLLARCHRLLDQGFDDLTVHGLGSAIHRAINLALQLQETSSHTLGLTASTSTVQLVDDLEPMDDDDDYQTQSRLNSAIHIHLTKALSSGSVKSSESNDLLQRTSSSNT